MTTKTKPWSKIAASESQSTPTLAPRPDFQDDDIRGALLVELAPRVRASLRDDERVDLVEQDGHTPGEYLTPDDLADLDALILFALACVLDHSPKKQKDNNAYLLVAARNFLRSTLRHDRALKRRDPDAVMLSIDDPDVPLVVADIEGSPLDHLLAKEAVNGQVRAAARTSPKPLARANARLRLRKRRLAAQ